MDLGLYLLKFPFRRMIGFLIPFCKNIDPNMISRFLLLIGAIMAGVYYLALTGSSEYLFLVGITLGFLRMIVSTLDGLVAVHYHKSSSYGDVVNRLTPEVCDMMLLPTLVLVKPIYPLGIFVLLLAWATPFFGMLGAPSGIPVQSVGPVGQTDRLAALMLFSLLQFLSQKLVWGIDFIVMYFYWLVVGGVVTLLLRYYRVRRDAKAKDLARSSK